MRYSPTLQRIWTWSLWNCPLVWLWVVVCLYVSCDWLMTSSGCIPAVAWSIPALPPAHQWPSWWERRWKKMEGTRYCSFIAHSLWFTGKHFRLYLFPGISSSSPWNGRALWNMSTSPGQVGLYYFWFSPRESPSPFESCQTESIRIRY